MRRWALLLLAVLWPALAEDPGRAAAASPPAVNPVKPTASAVSGAATVVVTRERLVVTRDQGFLRLLDLVELENRGESPITGLYWPLAAGARELSIDGRPAASQLDRALIEGTLGAGRRRELVLTYQVPVRRFPAAIWRPIWYPTESLVLLAEARELAIEAPGLAAGATQDLEGVPIQVYAGRNLAPDPGWQLTVHRGSQAAMRGLLSGALVAVALLGASLAISRRGRRARAEGPAERRAAEALVQAIAQLDLAFERGEVSQEAYTALRQRLKERWRRSQARAGGDRHAPRNLAGR